MEINEKAKRKNDDKPKGLPRRRIQVLGGLLIAAVMLVIGSLILRTTLMPDGPSGHLYYKSSETGFVLDFATGQQTQIDDVSTIPRPPILQYSPTSPDGYWTASWEVSGYESALVISGFNGRTHERIELGTFHTGGSLMTWAPDSQWVVFSANTDPITMLPYPGATEELFRANIETRQVEQLTFNDYLDEWPSYSPNGTRIAYASASDGHRRLWIMDLDTRTSTLIVPNMFVYFPTWSPDGRWITFMTDHADPAGDIWIVRVDGSQLQPVAIGPENAYEPVWQS